MGVWRSVAKLLPTADEIICTPTYHRGAKVGDIYAIVKQATHDSPCRQAATIELTLTLANTKQNNMAVLITGGVLSVGENYVIHGNDPQKINAF